MELSNRQPPGFGKLDESAAGIKVSRAPCVPGAGLPRGCEAVRLRRGGEGDSNHKRT